MDSEQKRIFVAVILSGIILFGWQLYFGPQDVTVGQEQHVAVGNTGNVSSSSSTRESQKVVSNNVVENSDEIKIEKESFKLDNGSVSYTLNNDMSVVMMTNVNEVFTYETIVGEKGNFSIEFKINNIFTPLFFELTKISDSEYKGVNTKHGVSTHLQISKENILAINVKSITPIIYRFINSSSEKTLENNQIRNFLYLGKDIEREEVGEELATEGSVKWFGIDFNYHLFAAVLNAKAPFKIFFTKSSAMIMESVTPLESISYNLIFTKKNYDDLVKMGHNLKLSVDFGFFGILAVPILRGLQFFYELIPNWGMAIILLTLVIRTLTFPLQYKSFKSMKKMQNVQPELNKLKEKFKDDPQRMQKETMDLFKREGANPLGGCLPLLLQMPIFFAFYRVLYAAVELVDAPFYGWIIDLSVKDPFYVLPVLMALSMFLQQKMTPTTSVDPTQQKIMMFMPLIFGLIMKDLPSGLVLYIFVSTIFGITQQMFVYKTMK